MNAKDFRKKMEALYKGVNPSDRKQNDQLILSDEYRVIINKERWAKLSDKERQEVGSKITKGKLTITEDVVQEIWSKVWGPNRNNGLYEKLAKEYNTTKNIVGEIARGGHLLLTDEQKNSYDKKLEQWHNQYGYNKRIYTARSPGNDLLDKYDEYQLDRHPLKRGKLKASEIFDIRFRWDDKSDKAVREYCDEKGFKVDNAMYATYRDKTMGWLVDEPHQAYEFDSFVEMSKWMCERVGAEFKGGGQIAEGYTKKKMVWQDRGFNLNGWIFEAKDK